MGKPAAAYALLLGVAGACRVSQDPLVACAAPGNPLGLGPALDDACAAELSSLEQQQLVPQSTPRLPGAAGTRGFIADLAPRRLAPDEATGAGARTLPPRPSRQGSVRRITAPAVHGQVLVRLLDRTSSSTRRCGWSSQSSAARF